MPGLLGAACLTALVLAGLAAGQQRDQNAGGVQQAADTLAGAQPGDVIRVWIWREPDLSGDFPVDSRGRAVLPLLGEVQVPGKGAERLADELREAYRRFLNNPSIQVTVLRRVGIQGAVGRPGLYPVDATISVAELIALAGGVTSTGNPRKIRLVRGDSVVLPRLSVETILERSPVQSGDQILVPEKSWLARNGTVFLTASLSALTAILVFELTR